MTRWICTQNKGFLHRLQKLHFSNTSNTITSEILWHGHTILSIYMAEKLLSQQSFMINFYRQTKETRMTNMHWKPTSQCKCQCLEATGADKIMCKLKLHLTWKFWKKMPLRQHFLIEHKLQEHFSTLFPHHFRRKSIKLAARVCNHQAALRKGEVLASFSKDVPWYYLIWKLKVSKQWNLSGFHRNFYFHIGWNNPVF